MPTPTAGPRMRGRTRYPSPRKPSPLIGASEEEAPATHHDQAPRRGPDRRRGRRARRPRRRSTASAAPTWPTTATSPPATSSPSSTPSSSRPPSPSSSSATTAAACRRQRHGRDQLPHRPRPGGPRQTPPRPARPARRDASARVLRDGAEPSSSRRRRGPRRRASCSPRASRSSPTATVLSRRFLEVDEALLHRRVRPGAAPRRRARCCRAASASPARGAYRADRVGGRVVRPADRRRGALATATPPARCRPTSTASSAP